MTDHINGLTSEEVKKLDMRGLSNKVEHNTSKTVGEIVKENIFTFFNLLFFFFAILVITTGKFNNLTFVIVVVINTAIGIFQELKSKQVLDKLTVLTASKTKVIRDGKELEVNTDDLVKGDLCIFATGDQIGADAEVVDGEAKLNEALVTGESDEILKRKGDTLLSGSFVISGHCKAILRNVGEQSYVNKLTKEAKQSKGKTQTEMMKALTNLLKIIGIIMIPIGIILFVQDMFFLNIGYSRTIESVVAALVGMIPEGLYLLTSIVLTTSVTKLGINHVLVQEMASVETLARVNVLCLDKTGTLTENEMSFEDMIPIGKYTNDDENKLVLNDMFADFITVMSDDNVTMSTLKKSFGNISRKQPIKVFPFTSTVKYSAVKFEDGTYVLGAPEKLLLFNIDEYKEIIDKYSNIGNRVLLFGKMPNGRTVEDGQPLSCPVEPLSLILLTNPIRETARPTIDYFQQQNVEVKVISGDNPATVASVAGKCGIKNADKYIDASTLKAKEDIYDAVKEYTVFGRVVPSQKKMIVEALQSQDKVVAMTGDGVNDVLALKKADCSIAIGQGSEVVKNVSKIVLLDSDFSHMVQVVGEGRQVVNNIQRTASLFLVKNIYSLLMAIFVMMSGSVYPIYPTQMSYLSLVTIGFPGFFMSFELCTDLIKGKFLSTIIKRALPAGLTNFIIVTIMTIIARMTGIEFGESSTMSLILLLVVGITMLYRISRPFSKYRIFIFGLVCFVTVGGLIVFPNLFAFHALQAWEVAVVCILSVIAIAIFIFLNKLESKIERKINNSEFRYSKLYRILSSLD